MLTEAEAIPYQPALLRGERLLVLAPHPDDEAIGCGGIIAQHLGEHRAVRIVIATDGAAGGDAAAREEEARRGIARLGNAEIVFLGFRDRTLGNDAGARLREQLLEFRPDLVLVPSPLEIHPDHVALSRVFCETIQRDEMLFADLAVTRVAFYEVSAPLPRPNMLVDITGVAETKYAAIAEHASQLAVRDYVGYARGLNSYRAMTLPAGTAFAEAYLVVDLPSLRTTPFSAIVSSRAVEVVGETLPVSVVIRTKDRPALMAEAIASVRATGYPCEIVVVNDGGAKPDVDGVTLIQHETSQGRAEAANAGVRAAKNAFISFLDDDDLFYPEHLATLANAAKSPHAAWYTDAVSAFLRPGETGAYETHSRLRLYTQDYDRELLLLDNYIPLPTLLLSRETFLDLGGFDPAFDLFEDWELLIRLSQRGSFLHVPRITCEVRHFEGGSSVVLAAPEGSPRFRAAKLQVWHKHAALIDNNVMADVLERQKRRSGALYSDLIEAKGQTDAAQLEIARGTRESIESMNAINGYSLRVRELEGALHATQVAAAGAAHTAYIEMQDLVSRIDAKTVQIEHLTRENQDLRGSNTEAARALDQLRAEIDRLNGLLGMIYRSKTWKVHTTIEKLRGRG